MGVETEPPTTHTCTRILIADDHDRIREAIRQFVDSYHDLCVVGEARNGVRAVELARQLHPDIVLMDFHMPGMNGDEATRAIRQELPEVKVISVSVHPQVETLMLEAGACAHVSKSDLIAGLYLALRAATASPSLLPSSSSDPRIVRGQVTYICASCMHQRTSDPGRPVNRSNQGP